MKTEYVRARRVYDATLSLACVEGGKIYLVTRSPSTGIFAFPLTAEIAGDLAADLLAAAVRLIEEGAD